MQPRLCKGIQGDLDLAVPDRIEFVDPDRFKSAFMAADQGFELSLGLGSRFCLVAEHVYTDIPAALGAGYFKAVDCFSQQPGAFLGMFIEHFLAEGHRLPGGDALAGGELIERLRLSLSERDSLFELEPLVEGSSCPNMPIMPESRKGPPATVRGLPRRPCRPS